MTRNKKTPFTIALPAGRLASESLDFFKRSNLADFIIPDKTRELMFEDSSGNFRVIMVRSQDVPTYVLSGAADAGIAGRDVLAERGYDLLTVPMELPFGGCHLSVAAPVETSDTLWEKSHLRVATKYPRLSTDWFFSKGISCEVIKLYGSIEIAPKLGMADCIVDLVSTGSTLKANGLKEMDTILESTAMLVVNRAAYALQTDSLNLLLHKLKSELLAVAK